MKIKFPEHDAVMHNAVREVLHVCGLTGGDHIAPYNFRCPICGDSETNPHKKRGYVMFNDGVWTYVCYNKCGSMNFIDYLKQYHPMTYRDVTKKLETHTSIQ